MISNLLQVKNRPKKNSSIRSMHFMKRINKLLFQVIVHLRKFQLWKIACVRVLNGDLLQILPLLILKRELLFLIKRPKLKALISQKIGRASCSERVEYEVVECAVKEKQ